MDIRGSRVVKAFAGLLAVALMSATGGCGTAPDPQAEPQTPSQEETSGPIEVISSINQWGSLAKQIGGDDVNVTSILSSTSVDAHDFEPKTSDVAKISKAQIVVVNGAGYDTWASKSVGRKTVTVSAAQIVGAMEGDNPHLWFSKDARSGMAKELVNAFSKALPSKKADFTKRYKAWQQDEQSVEQKMDEFAAAHKDASYAATESVAYYLMSDMGFTDKTPQGYAASAAAEGEAAPADLQEFQKLLEDKDVDLLVNNTQEASDATNMITGTAGRSDIPVFDVSEQMPENKSDLTDWIDSLVDGITDLLTVCTTDEGTDGTDTNGSGDADTDASSDGKSDAGTSSDDDSSSTSGTAACKAPSSSDSSDSSGSSDDSKSDSSDAGTSSNDTQPDPGK
ncbi:MULTISPECIES: metal ABC transporter solute-binding protein, Zn/Mn family [Bifidobacterium]|uniref:metal ABC transporter solute-binding protein, Zn/Mn family n=1 Tax=Bifidobacterium TaxID=1678 RepID=UPI001BDDB847|nr:MULTISPECIES: zinc ABC transporter substrate-binding protein [Bifidobacterium]MBT1161179.1 zinc ABC transporter substrate-binding protein [Bifidobacterium sp. SO1]MBW3078324.1 zinc ABC transporter substrate-binding protein [Bifidobacterium simiiventris]